MQIHGHVDPRFEGVRAAFATNFADHGDVGASFCATVKGKVVVDIWGGVADAETGAAWEKDTIVNVYSTTKTMCALSALLLADRGELDFARPVADYWPEFAANGKARVTTAQLMAHSSGLSGWHEKIDRSVLYDWEKATGLLAAQAPFWEPGTAPGYHGLTQGFLVGEVIRRITGVSPGTFFRTELAEPLGADFHIGLPASEDARVATLIPPPTAMAMRGRWRWSRRLWPMAAWRTARSWSALPGCAARSNRRSRAMTRFSPSRCISGWAMACRAGNCRCPTPKAVSGAVMAARWSSTT